PVGNGGRPLGPEAETPYREQYRATFSRTASSLRGGRPRPAMGPELIGPAIFLSTYLVTSIRPIIGSSNRSGKGGAPPIARLQKPPSRLPCRDASAALTLD